MPTPSQGLLSANKRPFEPNKAGPVATGGKLAFSLKKAKVAVAPVFADGEEEEEDTADVEWEEPAKRQRSAQADAREVAGLAGAVGNHLFIYVLLLLTCLVLSPLLDFFFGVLTSKHVLIILHAITADKNGSWQLIAIHTGGETDQLTL